MSTDRRVSASCVAECLGGIEDFFRRHGHHWYKYRELIVSHTQVLLLRTSTSVHCASNVSRVLFRIPRCRVNSHPTRPVAKGAEDDTLGMRTWARLSDRPAV